MNKIKNSSSENILLSIIIPCYNSAQYIDRCLSSIFNQTLNTDYFQVLLINDASTDNTYDKLLEWEQKYPDQIILFNNEINVRQGTSRNIGINFAIGKYIGFVDSDDWIEHDMYEKLIIAAEAGQCEVVSCFFVSDSNMETIPSGKNDKDEKIIYYIFDDNNKSEFIAKNIMNSYVTTKIYKREFLMNHSIFFPDGIVFEDIYFIEMVNAYLTSYAMLTNTLYHYCITPESTVRTHNSKAHYDIIIACNSLWEECTKRGLFQKPFGPALEFRFLFYYWRQGLYILVVQHDPIPYDVIIQMKSDILNKLPDFKMNTFVIKYVNSSLLSALLFKLLDRSLTRNDLIQIVDKLKEEHLFM